MKIHPDDALHPPGSPDPFWTETWWFDFTVPERRLSGQLSVFARPNLGVCMSAAHLWDESGGEISNCLYSKTLWHVPLPQGDLSDLELLNGMRMRCTRPLSAYEVRYRDPDDGETEVELRFEGLHAPHYMTDAHLDQLGRFTGEIRVGDETIPVDCYGMRDRSWHVRSQIGTGFYAGKGPDHGAYTFGAASDTDGFLVIAFDHGEEGCTVIGGYLLRDAVVSRLVSGRRKVLERKDGCPVRILIEATDELGRDLQANGHCANRLHLMMYPNHFAWNCLTQWRFGGLMGWGEDRDNWTAAAMRRFRRGETAG
jgi:hypothetical protein